MDTRKRLEKVLTTALGQSFEECPNAKKVVIQQTLFIIIWTLGMKKAESVLLISRSIC